MTKTFFLGLLGLLCLFGCTKQSAPAPDSAPSGISPPAGAQTKRSLPKIVAFGDSLTAGLGLSANDAYPALLQQLLKRDGYEYEVVNSGVSGDTSAGGVRRIDWALDGGDGEVHFLILELGANDFLRGQPIGETRRNLAAIIDRAQGKNTKVLLAGMLAPTNAGREYQEQIRNMFLDLAREKNVTLIPFFLESVAGREGLNQPDGIHPNAAGTKLVAETVYKHLKPMLDQK
ncbi:MAG TPA: arylesterase [Pyrinomonadaceae bacterium]|nr:arylesterase [Pyrinomonadaceae bacterium]